MRIPEIRPVGIAGLLIMAMSVALPHHASGQDAVIPAVGVETVRVEPTELEQTISLVGHIRPWVQATLYSKVAGYLEWIGVDRGSWVRKGDVIARVDDPEMELEWARLRADNDAKRAIYERLQAAQDASPDLVSPMEVERAKGALKAAAAARERIQKMVEYAAIRAPYDGVITNRWVDPGALIQLATASQTPAARIAHIMNFDTVRVELEIPEADCRAIRERMPATVRISEHSDEVFSGQVARIAWAIDPETRTMSAEIDVPNPGHSLRPGMYAVCEIGLGNGESALRVPSEAVIVDGDARFVWTVRNGQAYRIPVTVTADDGINAEIASGLSPSDHVVVKGWEQLMDGTAVNVTETSTL